MAGEILFTVRQFGRDGAAGLVDATSPEDAGQSNQASRANRISAAAAADAYA